MQIALRELPIHWTGKYFGFYLLTYMNGDGEAWPTLKRAVHELAIARGSVRKGSAELETTGWLIKRSSRNGNRYYPQLTPDLERLVDDFLDAARRRRGQLPLPLDPRGLSLATGSGGDQRASQSGQEGSPRDHEFVREVERQMHQASRDVDGRNLNDPLVDLVSDLRDRDAGTLHVFRTHFGGLSDWAVEHAHDELRRRRKASRARPLQSEARFAFSALRRRKEGGPNLDLLSR